MKNSVPPKPLSLSVSAFIRSRRGNCLLLQRSGLSKHFAGCWETPGGKPDPRESFDQALVREVREETGLEVQLDGVVGASEFELEKIRVVVLYMGAHVIGGRFRLSGEHSGRKWLAVRKFASVPLTPALQRLMDTVRLR
jgi:8-oxo-dGTP diphosphatase